MRVLALQCSELLCAASSEVCGSGINEEPLESVPSVAVPDEKLVARFFWCTRVDVFT